MTSTELILLPLTAITASAALIDVRTRHIPNWLVLLGFTVGSIAHLATSISVDCATGSPLGRAVGSAGLSWFLGTLICAIVPVFMFQMGAMGGGDVKLLAVVGASLGPRLGIQVELFAFVLAALCAPIQLAWQGQLPGLLGNTAILITNPFLPKSRRRPMPGSRLTSLPFGPSIFLGTLLVAVAQRWHP
ncbi:MAG TPA: A24 family peptidase [Polyangiaceae bacterium]|nr:A24 family peptidase [Polyangiaceae bacterium]